MSALSIFKRKPVAPKHVPSLVKHVVSPQSSKVGDVQLVRPHITEKATDLSSTKNQYVFVVQEHATKSKIAKDVENRYGVKVTKARIIRVHPKKMRLGRTKGTKKGYKKAVVTLPRGQKIEIVPT